MLIIRLSIKFLTLGTSECDFAEFFITILSVTNVSTPSRQSKWPPVDKIFINKKTTIQD